VPGWYSEKVLPDGRAFFIRPVNEPPGSEGPCGTGYLIELAQTAKGIEMPKNIRPASRLNEVGAYYFANKLREIAHRQAEGADIINLGVGSPDLSPPAPATEALAQGARQADVHGYQSYRGLPVLRRAFARWYSRHFGAALDPGSEVLPLMGSKEGIMHLSMAFLDAGDEVLVPDPGYPAYRAAARLAGARVRPYRLREREGWLPALEELARTDLRRVKVMWVNYPHMPTGAVADAGFMQAMLDLARAGGFLLVNDNPYALLGSHRPVGLLGFPQAREVALELHSLSKSHHMAGWRIGMMAGDSAYLDAVLRFKSNMDSGMFRPLQQAAAAALDVDASWYGEVNRTYGRRRKLMQTMLRSLGCRFREGQSGLFVWARVPPGWKDGYAFSDRLLDEAGLFVAPGGIFGSQGEGYIRASLCQPEPVLKQALDRLERWSGHSFAKPQHPRS